MNEHVYGVILAGGSGTRFWPLSRELYPKQMLRILGDRTLIQETVRRTLRCIPATRILIVTNSTCSDLIKLQLRQWWNDNGIEENIVIEPEERNTAPAIAMAATILVRRDPSAIMLVLPSDHVIKGARKFKEVVKLGTSLAEDGHLVTLGVHPAAPETGYGYIEPDVSGLLKTQGAFKGYRVKRFVEKPTLNKAKTFLRMGRFLWNSGIFTWKASTILGELAMYQPTLARGIKKVDMLLNNGDRSKVDLFKTYRRLPSLPIDKAVMERTSNAVVIPVDFLWSDVGSWNSLGDVVATNGEGNVVKGNVIDLGSENSVLFGTRRLVATIGLKDMVLVDTPDATLVCPKSKSQDVKHVVDILKKRNAVERLEHQTVFCHWGYYTILDGRAGCTVKRLTVLPSGKLSVQQHPDRGGHWVVIRGKARLTCGSECVDRTVGQSLDISHSHTTHHIIENLWSERLELIEIRYRLSFGEDDMLPHLRCLWPR